MLPRMTRAVAGLVVVLTTLDPVSTRADDGGASASLDQSTFLSRALARSPRWRALDERTRAATAAVGAAGILPNPTLSYERESVPSLDNHDNFVRLGWNLDLAGRRGLAKAAARASAEGERLDVDRDAFLAQLEARLAYVEAMYARDLVARLDEARVPLVGLVEALASRARQGDTSSYDAERATLELDNLDDERASAKRRLELARLRLGALLGEPEASYGAADPLTLPPRPATAPALVRPDIDAALARATRADREATAARRAWIPRLDLTVGLLSSTSSGVDGVGYVVGIGGELPVFERGGAAAAKHRAEAKRWRSEAEALAIEARGELEQARRELTLRIEQAEAYVAGPGKRASDLARRAAVAYREGDRPILELLDVQRAARHAVLRSLELVYEARRAELALDRVAGRRR